MVGAFVLPVYPYAALCTVLVLADCVSAIGLRRRLRRQGASVSLPLVSSSGFGRCVMALVRIYAALLVAHGADVVFGVDCCLRFTGAVICVHQALSILENEASAGGAAWAGWLRRYLADKARRHIDIKD